MEYNTLLDEVKKLKFDLKKTIYSKDDVEIYLIRPTKVKGNFKNYDINKNFQVFLKTKNREFRPNHLRVIMDLYLRSLSRPDLKEEILELVDLIFYKKEFSNLLEKLKQETFNNYLNKNLDVTIYLLTLFVIEQDYNYFGKSFYKPKSTFLIGWVRQVLCDNSRDLDNYIMSICNNQPPKTKFTEKDSKIKRKIQNKQSISVNNEKYEENPKKLWYV
ncbi:MAG: hypothetical protein ACMXYB_00085 [Candidatus Woesearchaeota archaeon]